MYYCYKHNAQKWKSVVVTSGAAVFAASTFFSIIAYMAVGPALGIRWLLAVIIYDIMMALQSFYGYLARTFGYSKTYALSGMLSTVINAASCIVTVVIFGLGAESLLWGASAGMLVQVAVIENKVNAISLLNISSCSTAMIGRLLRFSVPLCVSSIGYWLLSSYTKVCVVNYLGAEANGIYAVGMRFSTAINLVSSCLVLGWQEISFSVNKGKEARLYGNALDIFALVLGCASCILMLVLTNVYPHIMSDEYGSGVQLMPLCIAATAFDAYMSFCGTTISSFGKNTAVFLSMIISGLFNIVFVNTLMPRFGLVCAPLSLMASFTIGGVIRFLILTRGKNVSASKWNLLFLLSVVSIVSLMLYQQIGALYISIAISLSAILGILLTKRSLNTGIKGGISNDN